MILNPEKWKALVLSCKPNTKLSLFAEGVVIPQLDQIELFGLIQMLPSNITKN